MHDETQVEMQALQRTPETLPETLVQLAQCTTKSFTQISRPKSSQFKSRPTTHSLSFAAACHIRLQTAAPGQHYRECISAYSLAPVAVLGAPASLDTRVDRIRVRIHTRSTENPPKPVPTPTQNLYIMAGRKECMHSILACI